MKPLFFGTLILVVLSAVGCSTRPGVADKTSRSSNAVSVARAGVPVSTVMAQQRDLIERLDLTGTITPDAQVTLYARTSGYLKSISVDIGDRIRKGQLLAELDAPEMITAAEEKRAAVEKAEAALEQAKAAVEQSQAEIEFAEVTYKRLQAIHDRDADVLPEQDVDEARANYGVARSKLKSAERQVKVAGAAVASSKAELATLETLLQYAHIVAPMEGVVTERFVDPGALIQAASSSRTQAAPVVSIARLDRVRVMVDVPEPNVPLVHPGTAAALQVPGFLGETFPARVARVGRVLDSGSRTMRAEIDLSNPGERLRPGMTARVTLELKKIANGITVPVAALRSQDSQRIVFVVEGGKAKQVKVKTGLESPEWVQVVEGLRDGEEVVVAWTGLLKDGATVDIKP